MELKTKVTAEDGQQQITVTREFDLPVALLYKAYTLPEFVTQWMGTQVLRLDTVAPGAWAFETRDPEGNVLFAADGTLHALVPDRRIVRTFQMKNAAGFDAQLEFLDFEALTETTSKLTMQIVYRSVALRDQMLKLPFAYGVSMAHNRLEEVMKQPQ